MKNLPKKERIYLAVCCLWLFVNIIMYFLSTAEDEPKSYLFPFYGSIDSYDFSELLIYGITPFILFTIYKVFFKKEDFQNIKKKSNSQNVFLKFIKGVLLSAGILKTDDNESKTELKDQELQNEVINNASDTLDYTAEEILFTAERCRIAYDNLTDTTFFKKLSREQQKEIEDNLYTVINELLDIYKKVMLTIDLPFVKELDDKLRKKENSNVSERGTLSYQEKSTRLAEIILNNEILEKKQLETEKEKKVMTEIKLTKLQKEQKREYEKRIMY